MTVIDRVTIAGKIRVDGLRVQLKTYTFQTAKHSFIDTWPELCLRALDLG